MPRTQADRLLADLGPSPLNARKSALDPVVQAVLTDKNANIDALLNAANTQVQAIIDKG